MSIPVGATTAVPATADALFWGEVTDDREDEIWQGPSPQAYEAFEDCTRAHLAANHLARRFPAARWWVRKTERGWFMVWPE